MSILSQAERDFIEGRIQPTPNYRRVLIHRIKRKRENATEELELIDAFLRKLEKI
jgi:hypothetical protein